MAKVPAFRMSTLRMALFVLASCFVAACSRTPVDATPDGALRAWIDKMENGGDDPHAMSDAYRLLGPRARANLKERAERASRGQGRRYEPYEMFAAGRFGLNFRPKSMTSHAFGDTAVVDVRGESEGERAEVHCVRENDGWRIEPELPEVSTPVRADPVPDHPR